MLRNIGRSGGGGVLGALGSVKDAIKDKPTPHSTDKDTAVLYGGEGEAKAGRRLGVDEEGTPVVVLVDVETTPAGATASRLKEADQISGQTFNDVGPLDDEETKARVWVDRPGKM